MSSETMVSGIRATPKLQRLFDRAIPVSCKECGMLIAIAPSRNGVDMRLDVDDQSNPTFTHHKCPTARIKKEIYEKLKVGGTSTTKIRLHK